MADPIRSFGKLSGVFGKVTVKSALNSQVWLIGFFLFVIGGLAFVPTANQYVIGFLCLLLLLIVLFFFRCYDYFMQNNPDLLRSESFQIQKQQIEMMGAKNKEVPAQVIEAEPVIQKPTSNSDKKHIAATSKKGVPRK